ncbi:MAG: Stp1/IreP family PP2C-type Ser/Thr phosphatase [Coriobacteriales bacterium]|nr:Stp1/IreP family PP2C-type Ser/Thr phosphatase [Coriobacteriales bacterium]
MSNTQSFRCGSRTDLGRMRPHNEDSLIVMQPLFAVADGMGGHAAGEVASEIAIETLVNHAPSHLDTDALGRAVEAANRAIIRAVQQGKGRPGMGTTLTACMVEGNVLSIAQVGDSRAYLLHQGQLQRLTRDHSLVEELVERGEISAEQARWHPQRSVITRALGSDLDTQPDLYELDVSPGDRLMICSDGLYGMIGDSQIKDLLRTPDPQAAADALVDAANEAGGHDNITVVVVDIPGDPTADTTSAGSASGAHSMPSSGSSGQGANTARFRWKPVLIFASILLLLVLGAAGGVYAYARSSYYVTVSGSTLSVYRGLPGSVAGVELSWFEHSSDVEVEYLPRNVVERLDKGIQVDSLEDADALIDSYRQYAPKTTTSSSTQGNSTSRTIS